MHSSDAPFDSSGAEEMKHYSKRSSPSMYLIYSSVTGPDLWERSSLSRTAEISSDRTEREEWVGEQPFKGGS